MSICKENKLNELSANIRECLKEGKPIPVEWIGDYNTKVNDKKSIQVGLSLVKLNDIDRYAIGARLYDMLKIDEGDSKVKKEGKNIIVNEKTLTEMIKLVNPDTDPEFEGVHDVEAKQITAIDWTNGKDLSMGVSVCNNCGCVVDCSYSSGNYVSPTIHKNCPNCGIEFALHVIEDKC